MPYALGIGIFMTSVVIVFATFAYLLVNARSLMLLFRPMSDGEIKAGPGPRRASKGAAAFALVLHFVAWAVAGATYVYMLADVRATAPDTTTLEKGGIVDSGNPPKR